jgi:UDP-N-acetyl-2-amino-2-deoxyglucuronate dehydrogenase
MLKYAILGCGRIAQRHAKHIQTRGKLVAVCDIKRDRANALAKRYNAKAYYNIATLLQKENNLDLVSICTPNGLHAKHTILSLQAGNNVLCEKPMALSVKECRKMINTAKKTRKKLMIVMQNRFNPPVAAVKKTLGKNKLGKITDIQLNCFWNRNPKYYSESEWKGTKNLDGGILFTQFSHFIDLVYWFMGDVVEAKTFSDKFKNGAVGALNFTINTCSKNMEGSITIFGTKGTVKIGGQYLNELEYQDIENFKISDLPKGNPPNKYGHYVGSMSNHDKVYDNVVDVLNRNGKISTNGGEGLKTVEIIEKIYHANRRK